MNGESVSFSGTGVPGDDQVAMAEAINAGTDDHGVTASIENGEFVISNDQGEDIDIVDFTADDGAGTPLSTTLTVTSKSFDGEDDEGTPAVLKVAQAIQPLLVQSSLIHH